MSSPPSGRDPALVRALTVGLPVRREEPVQLDSDISDAVLRTARFDHVTGFLADAVLRGDVVVADEHVAAAIDRQWREELHTVVLLESMFLRTVAVLSHVGVDWRVTKGVALAHLDYPDVSTRTFGDVDLIVDAQSWPETIGALAAAGYVRRSTVLSANFDQKYGKGATLLSPDGLELDLHLRFSIGRFGVTSHMADLFRTAQRFKLGGQEVRALDGAGRLLHACYHASLGGFRRLRAFRDVAQLILVTGADWETTFETARQWKAEAVVATAIVEAWVRLDLDVQHPAMLRALDTPISSRDQRALQHFTARSSFRSQALTAVPVIAPLAVPGYLWRLGAHKVKPWPRKLPTQ